MAQLGARFHGMEEVVGSIPTRSTNKPNNLAESQKKRDRLSIRWVLNIAVIRSHASSRGLHSPGAIEGEAMAANAHRVELLNAKP